MTEIKLSDIDIGTLCECRKLMDEFECIGIFPTTGGHRRNFEKLERQGLMKFAGFSDYNVDTGNCDPKPCWAITDAGREAIAEADRDRLAAKLKRALSYINFVMANGDTVDPETLRELRAILDDQEGE